jgi:DNA-binding transcriptional LysR family regulator
METHEIKYFLAVCVTLNFTRAAEACDVSTPSLTRAIKKLEDELGGQLFRRERRLTHLTDLGRLMQVHLAQASAATAAAQAEARRFAVAETRLKMGVISTMSSIRLVRYLKRLRRTAPQLDLDIWESHCADIAHALETGDLDIAIMSLPDYPDAFRAKPLYSEPYDVAFAPEHRYAEMNAVPLREFEAEDYVKRLHCEFPSNFARLGIAKPYQAVRVRYATEREDWVQNMVAAGLGMTLMPRYMTLLPGIETRPVVEPEVSRTVSIVTRAGRSHSQPVVMALQAARVTAWENEAAVG